MRAGALPLLLGALRMHGPIAAGVALHGCAALAVILGEGPDTRHEFVATDGVGAVAKMLEVVRRERRRVG